MHGLQGAEAQGSTLDRGPTGCKEIIFFQIIIYMGVCSSDNSILQTSSHTHFQRRPGCSSLYSEWFSLGSPHTVFVVGMFHRYTVSRVLLVTCKHHNAIKSLL